MLGIETIQKQPKGFTIVELVVIIVVIGILIGIVSLSYSSILNNSRAQALESDISAAYSKLLKYRTTNGTYPTGPTAAGVVESETTTYAYTYTSGTDTYCLSATAYNMTKHVVSGNSESQDGPC